MCASCPSPHRCCTAARVWSEWHYFEHWLAAAGGGTECRWKLESKIHPTVASWCLRSLSTAGAQSGSALGYLQQHNCTIYHSDTGSNECKMSVFGCSPRLAFSDEFKGKLNIKSVGAVQIPWHYHPQTILLTDRQVLLIGQRSRKSTYVSVVSMVPYPFEDEGGARFKRFSAKSSPLGTIHLRPRLL